MTVENTTQPAKRGGKWSLALLVIAAIVISLLLAEGLVRLANQAGLVDLSPSLDEIGQPEELEDQVNPEQSASEKPLYTADPRLHHRMEPNWSGYFPAEMMERVGRSQVPISTNSLGLREDEVDRPKPVDRFRVLALGDSVTFGWGVRQEDTYAGQLASLMATLRPDQAIDVINAGVSGYGTWQELLWLEELGPELDPDVVVVQVHLNDAADNLWGTWGWDGGSNWLAQNSMLVRLVRRLTQANRAAGGSGTSCERDWTEGQERVCWDQTLALLADLDEVAQSQGATLIVMPAPMRWQVEPGVSDPRAWIDDARYQDELADFAGREGILFVDPLAAIRSHTGATGLSVFLDVGHPDEVGHRIMAQELYGTLAQGGLLP